MIAVTDSGPLIVLAKLGHLHLLSALYEQVIVPQAVYREVVTTGRAQGYPDAEAIRAFLQANGWSPTELIETVSELPGDARLGQGEHQAIALAGQHQAHLLMDEALARSVAEGLGLKTVGSLGILVEAYRQGLLTGGLLEQLLLTIESREDIWIHPDLCARVRREVLGQ